MAEIEALTRLGVSEDVLNEGGGMSEEYTPTTDEVRKHWVAGWEPWAELEAQYERLLAEVERAAAKKAVDDFEAAVLTHIEKHGTSAEGWPENPYRRGGSDE